MTKITYKDLSGWLKALVILFWIGAGIGFIQGFIQGLILYW